MSSWCLIDLLGELDWIHTLTSFCLTKKLAVSFVLDDMKSNSAELDFISSKTKETASFFVRQNDVRVCIQSSSPNKSIRHQELIGGKKPINKGSSGHVLSAYNNLEIKDKDEVLKNGYAMTFGERDSEMASISVPIFRKKNQILGALSVGGHISNFNKKNCIRFLNVLRSSRVKIEKNLIKTR